MQIGMGSTVTLHYSLAFRDGTVVASSFWEEPLCITIGEGALHRTLELALLGLRAGQTQALALMPGQAFGERDAAAECWMPRKAFPADIALEVGSIVEFDGPDGKALTGALMDVRAGPCAGGFQSSARGARSYLPRGDPFS